MKQISQSFPVVGMSCSACAVAVEDQLQQQDGVLKAEVNYADASVTITYNTEKTTATKLQKSLQELGYDLILAESTEAALAAQTEQKSNDLQQLQKKVIYSLLLSVPLMAISMFFMHTPYANYIMWALATPVLVLFGKQFYIQAFRQAKKGYANMDTLVALSTGIAYIFSVFNTIYPQFWKNKGLEAHVYFEAASVIIAFILLGKWLEEKAKSQTSTALKKLIELQPQQATRLLPDGSTQTLPISQIAVNDILLVKSGEKIPIDGIVLQGNSYIDESMLTGEPIPAVKQINDKVFAGTINQKGSLQIKAQQVGQATLLAQIIAKVQQAQGSKAPVQQLTDKIARIFVPIIVVIALLTGLVWYVAAGNNGLAIGLQNMITVLVIACPCALGLATPTAITVGIGKGAEMGMLIKDAVSLENARNINAIVLDKTGTITMGKPTVTKMQWLQSETDFAPILYDIEQKSEHPLATAVCQFLQKKDIKPITTTQFESLTGKGASAVYQNKTYFVGNNSWCKEKNITLSADLQQLITDWEKQAQTVIYFCDEQQIIAIAALSDAILPNAKNTITALQQKGIEIYMLTGDNAIAAQAVAQQVGITQFRANVLPQEKAVFIEKLQQQGKKVAMVGDGINDSAALAQADVSIAMSKGAAIAIEVAQVTLLGTNLTALPQLLQLSRQTVATIRQNLFWAFIYNVIGIPIAAGVLYPFYDFLLNPMIAGAAMAMSSISVVLNSLRLKIKPLKTEHN